MNRDIRSIAEVKPSKRQLQWQQTEFYAFLHFGMNTFTNSEWGHGDEDPKLFNPVNLDADQWVTACKDAGMKAIILTCKHHDGFCLWPSKYTEHSVKSSPWKNGEGDVVKELSEACAKQGMKFGVYVSPWDRHEKTYGQSELYNEFFKNQLREVLTNYGELFCVWFDGACGEGENGKKQVYDWDGYYEVIRELQPNASITICGPDVRWCGNEAGHCRKSEWSVVPSGLLDTEKIQENSQQVDDGEFAKKYNAMDEDLGSRELIKDAKKLIWYPCEVDTSIRPGWFYHSHEDDKVRSLDTLLNIYYNSVGGNACLLLNIPPDKNGLIHENDVRRLKELGDSIKEIFKVNLIKNSELIASETLDDEHNINNTLNNDRDSYWCPKEGTEQASIDIKLNEEIEFDKVVLMEHIEIGQRIERFTVEYKCEDKWVLLYEGTTVGYKKICCCEKVKASEVRITINESRWCPTLSHIGLY